MIIKLNMHIYI